MEQVHQRAGGQEQVRQPTVEVRAMFGQQKEQRHRGKTAEDPGRSGAPWHLREEAR